MSDAARLEYGIGTVRALGDAVVGRRREIEVVVAALMSGRHLLLEGPPGTGKSTLLRSIAEASGHELEFCEGNADLTPARLSGHFDPAQVLEAGYVKDIWIDGPLTRALLHGSLLYLEEINRIPEETLNLLVTVMSEGELTIPRLGQIVAHPDFRFVAAMNPFDAVGTARISGAIYDRVCRVAMDYQSDQHEREIAARSSHSASASPLLVAKSVALVRETRSHPDLRVGASVRGAIDLVMVATELASLRSETEDPNSVNLDAALCALSGRIQVQDGVTRTPEDIITELFDAVFVAPDTTAEESSNGDADDSGKVKGRPMTATPLRQRV